VRLARRYLRRCGETPVVRSGEVLEDGSVVVPLIDGFIAHVAFNTVTETHCRLVRMWDAERLRAKANGVGNGNSNGAGAGHRPNRDEVKRALDVLLTFMTVADSASSTTHEQPFQYAAE
jgi:hypothetical protein